MLESRYQALLIKRLRREFPGCIIIKLPTDYQQGLPDLLILFGARWAALEVKAHEDSPVQPNQVYYVQLMNEMSWAEFIYPENEEEVIRELRIALGSGIGPARFSQP